MNHIASYIRQSLRDFYPVEELNALTMMICCDLLEMKAVDIYMGKDIILSESKKRLLENIIFRLQNNEPIQYIQGFASFGGRNFNVAPGVLIPRPETWELVERIVKENPQAQHVLDIGTGSGCIAISLAKSLSGANVEAWDVSEEALAIAVENNRLLEGGVCFKKQDVFAADLIMNPRFDVIVSNPPYITEKEKSFMEANVLNWEPEMALFVPDEDPLKFYRRIAEVACVGLLPGGRLYFEINQAYGQETAQLIQDKGFLEVRIIKDFFGNDRIVTGCR